MKLQNQARLARAIREECGYIQALLNAGNVEDAVFEVQKTANWLKEEIERQEQVAQEDCEFAQVEAAMPQDRKTGYVLTANWGAM